MAYNILSVSNLRPMASIVAVTNEPNLPSDRIDESLPVGLR